ncbi:TauD/TfdA family dioxygenase [Streptomyces noursei]|uniref:TauD/TfdA family dioxygenase n=1 Tax=Streptomyces noursei TaxID=1971 RepID=UPI0016753B58|nr:TauD/TfdA family dioxygenase [Streptomyces noursei]MCZ1013282.1 TauD/TfdA family dioxygenase [Streptomyces noursei]GGX53442.1 protein AmbC [Streptomyces noursei]
MSEPQSGSLAHFSVPAATPRPLDWLVGHRDEIRTAVAEHGAVLVRGLALDGRETAAAALRAVVDDDMAEREGFAPRDIIGRGVYSSSHWPAHQPMCMHHELSYVPQPPRTMAFTCLTPPASGGVTAVADSRAVLRDLPAGLVSRFEQHGWRLTRHYNPYVGISWQDAFGTDDRAKVDGYCAHHGIEPRWDADGGLHTVQTRPAVVKHPDTGERCWFNQVAFLNEWTMAPEVRDFLVSEFGPERLPFNTSCGDGSPLDRPTVDLINAVYDAHTVCEPWRRGDLLVIDNVRMAHSREPYEGEREVLVSMGGPFQPQPPRSVTPLPGLLPVVQQKSSVL